LPRRVRFVVEGRVQGVAYRASARHVALDEGLSGWVRNRDDGAVEGAVQGEPDAVARFLTWCEVGPPAARVTRVTSEDLPPSDEPHRFAIRP
jgi:acylphosphatase